MAGHNHFMPLRAHQPAEPTQHSRMPAKMHRHMVRHARMYHPVEPLRHASSVHFDEQAVARHPPPRRNALAFKCGQMIAAIARPYSRNRYR